MVAFENCQEIIICVRLMYFPRCVGNKVVVLSKPRDLELLWHQATYLILRFNLHKIYLPRVLNFAPLVIKTLEKEFPCLGWSSQQ